MNYKVSSFFAGIGGFDLGLEKAGMSVVFQCEINPFCQKVLKKNWPNIPIIGDIAPIESSDIPDSNVWCGGFPCQDVSLANQGKRKGLSGERSGLFFTYAKLIKERKPDWLIIENVPGLLNSHDGEDFRTIIETLDELGYGLSWRVLDAKYFGTPQRRRRVYIVGSLGNMRSARVLFEPGTTKFADKAGSGERSGTPSRHAGSLSASNIYAIQHAGIGRKPSAGPQAKGFRCDGETYTLDSRGSSDAVCATDVAFRVRKIAGVSEKLDSRRFRAVGNAVAVPIIEWIGKRIIEVDSMFKP
ncbi:DNA (cytosine-5-)-methyltransferase [Lelliottia amnigena]|uniref:DNA (cytosine-5-)-methyltransferase n=1 Tax=Lelliottia amnigena TaxID=61646 RepID=A0AAP2AIL0_LELAM|nr:DNA (cytosine-5-)-methyltransferase [Lelliottia amnigena]MBL5901700.1 DNA (cytosine-5-)-methyltransferase [Lelliottia amnigena]MBL5937212.1 DNA (cytosine-5-)-methyltransferase [Lelliottia amnigena]